MFYIFVISLVISNINAFLFPSSRYDIFQMTWVSCTNGSQISKQIKNGTLQLPINQNGLCQGAYNSLLPSEEGTYIYSFIFDTIIDSTYLLIISIDGRNYTVTNHGEMNISIRHKHTISCQNTLDFILLSQNQINLISFIIEKDNTTKRSQVITNHSLINSTFINITMFTWIAKASRIENNVISYSGFFNYPDPFLAIKIFYNDQLISECPYTFSWFNYTDIKFDCQSAMKSQKFFGGLKFLIQRKYTIEYSYPEFINSSAVNEDYYYLDQIDDSNTTIKQNQLGRAFAKDDPMIVLDYDFEIDSENLTSFKLKPKGYSQCNYNFRFVSIYVQNESSQFEYMLEYQNQDSTFQTQSDCLYYFQWDYNKNQEYYLNMTLIIDSGNSTQVGYQIVNFKMNDVGQFKSPDQKIEIKDILTVILMVILPIIISMIILLIYICFVSPRYYIYPWLAITELDDGGDFIGTRDLTPSLNRQQSDIIHVTQHQNQEQQAILNQQYQQ